MKCIVDKMLVCFQHFKTKIHFLVSLSHTYSVDDMDLCSLKVLEVDGSPSRVMLKHMGDQGCVLGDLMGFLQIMGHTDALQCLKPSGKLTPSCV